MRGTFVTLRIMAGGLSVEMGWERMRWDGTTEFPIFHLTEVSEWHGMGWKKDVGT